MSTLDQSIANSIRAYPTLFPTRTAVLHHYFCVNGNGMEWVDGELIDPYGEKSLSLESMIAEIKEKTRERIASFGELTGGEFDDFRREQTARITIIGLKEEMNISFRYNNANDLAMVRCNLSSIDTDDWLKPKPIYPLCQYACMNEVPDDIKPDWLAGVREMIFIVFESPAAKPNNIRSMEMCEAERVKNINFASNVLQTLCERFGSEKKATCYEEYVDLKEISRKANLATLQKMLNFNKSDKEENEGLAFKI